MQLAPAHRHRAVVARRPGGGVPGEVLQGGDDAGALQAPHVGGAEHRDEVGVLAHGLLDPAPAVVAHDVEHRREALVHADRRHVPPDRGGHPLDQVGVERRPPGDRRRVDRGAEGREPGQALLVDQRRDAQPGAVEDDLLLPHQLGGALGGGHRGAAEDPGEVAEPVPARLLERQRPAGREDVLHRRDVAVGVAVRGRLLAGVGPGVRHVVCRPSGCRAGPPSPPGSSARGAGRPARRSGAPGPATEASPGPPRGSGPVSSRGLLRQDDFEMVRNFSIVVRKTGSVGLSKHLDMPHRPFYLDICAVTVESADTRLETSDERAGLPRPVATASDDRLAAGGRGSRRREITVDPRTTVSAQLPRPGRGHRRRPGARRLRQLRPQRHGGGGGGGGAAAGAATYWFLTGQPGRTSARVRRPVQQGQPRRQDHGDDLPERRLQDEDQDGHRRRPGARPSSGAGAAAACTATSRPARSRTSPRGSPRTPRSRTGCSRPRSARRRSTARSTRCRPRRSSRSCSTRTRRSSTRSAPSRPSPGATS